MNLVDITDDFYAKGKNGFRYPFSFLDDFRGLLYHPLPSSDMKQAIIHNVKSIVEQFPKNIDAIYYFEVGENDGSEWRLVGTLGEKYGGQYFFFYEAGCDYTGFDCRGSMRLYLSDTFEELAKYAMTETTRQNVHRFQNIRSCVDETLTMDQYNQRRQKFTR